MMLKIRLARTGKKKQPNYRVVVANIDSKRDGRVVERIGHYNPLVNPAEYMIHEDRALYWLSVGAQPSDAVRRLLVKQGTIDRLQRFHAGEPLDSLVAEFSGVPSVVASKEEAVAVVAETAVEETAVEEMVMEEVAVEETVAEEVVAEEAVAEEAVAEETVTEETAAVEETSEEESA
ncbi:MAG: 30S ribosomal protein S16, partial [Anaerolineae bacterium]|nr:30S ribosomal protein S16 [Anaerolineae bacterium]